MPIEYNLKMNEYTYKLLELLNQNLNFIKRYYKLKSNLKILAYHNVENFESKVFKNLDVTLSVDNFYKQMKFLKKNYQIKELNDIHKNKDDFIKSNKSFIVITFDDGYKSIYENVFPIIKELKIPISIFIIPYFIENEKIQLLHLFNYLINERENKRLIQIFSNCLGRKNDVTKIKNEISNNLTIKQYDFIKEQILIEYKLNEKSISKELNLYMNRSDILEMFSEGVEFGNHSFKHYTLSKLNIDEQEIEIKTGAEIIRKMIGLNELPFAIPYGRKKHFTEKTLELVKKTNHYCALTLGSDVALDKLSFEISRLLNYPQLSIEANLWILPYLEDVKLFLKNIIKIANKNLIWK